jgi:hypothetical protein
MQSGIFAAAICFASRSSGALFPWPAKDRAVFPTATDPAAARMTRELRSSGATFGTDVSEVTTDAASEVESTLASPIAGAAVIALTGFISLGVAARRTDGGASTVGWRELIELKIVTSRLLLAAC